MKPRKITAIGLALATVFFVVRAWAGPLYVSNTQADTAAFDPSDWRSPVFLGRALRPGSLAIEPGGRFGWIIPAQPRRLQRVDLRAGGPAGEPVELSATALSLALSPDGSRLIVAFSSSPVLELVDPASGRVLSPDLRLPGNPVALFTIPALKLNAALLSNPAAAVLFDAAQPRLAKNIPLPFAAWDLAFSGDGRWMAASHEAQGLVSLVDLKGKALTRLLAIKDQPRGLALDETGSRLWVCHMKEGSGQLSLVDLAGDSVVATQRLVGEPGRLALLPAEGSRPAQLVAAAYVPEAQETGMLYVVDAGLARIRETLPLAGRPCQFFFEAALPPPAAARPAALSATAVAQDAADSPAADSRGNTWEASGSRGKFPGIFRLDLKGRLLDSKTGEPVADARIKAVNRKGKVYPGKTTQGKYALDGLPWGTYQIVVQAAGYKKLVLPEQTLALGTSQVKDLKLEPAAPQTIEAGGAGDTPEASK